MLRILKDCQNLRIWHQRSFKISSFNNVFVLIKSFSGHGPASSEENRSLCKNLIFVRPSWFETCHTPSFFQTRINFENMLDSEASKNVRMEYIATWTSEFKNYCRRSLWVKGSYLNKLVSQARFHITLVPAV